MQLFYLFCAFVQIKFKKKIRLAFFVSFFLVSVESLEFRAPTVRSNAVLAVERTCAYSSTVAYLRSPDMPLRASARHCSKQAMQFCVRTHLQSLLHICVATIDRHSCARAHLSCCSNRPEAVYVFCFLFVLFNYQFIYLFIMSIFICLIVVFSFCQFID